MQNKIVFSFFSTCSTISEKKHCILYLADEMFSDAKFLGYEGKNRFLELSRNQVWKYIKKNTCIYPRPFCKLRNSLEELGYK